MLRQTFAGSGVTLINRRERSACFSRSAGNPNRSACRITSAVERFVALAAAAILLLRTGGSAVALADGILMRKSCKPFEAAGQAQRRAPKPQRWLASAARRGEDTAPTVLRPKRER